MKTKILRRIFQDLCEDKAISCAHNSKYITCAGLNVKDRPGVAPYVEPITEYLYGLVASSGVEFDAVTSIPTGGDAWADSFARIASKHRRREVPLYRIQKGYDEFCIIDKQPSVKPNARLLVIDDTIYLGYTSKRVVSILETAGYQVTGLVFPVEVTSTGSDHWKDRGYPVFSAFNSAFVREFLDAVEMSVTT